MDSRDGACLIVKRRLRVNKKSISFRSQIASLIYISGYTYILYTYIPTLH